MPIKFRCTHCQQYLGISRAQAGEIVDCPTCGRTLRVPLPDGRVVPLPEPELNLDDTNLAKALDELAMIGTGPVEDLIAVADQNKAGSEPGVIEPSPLPEPVPVEPPLLSEPVPRVSRAPADGPQPSSPAVRVELADLVPPPSVDGSPYGPSAADSKGWRIDLSPRVLLAVAAVGTVTFSLGYLAGRSRDTPRPDRRASANGTTHEGPPPEAAAEVDGPARSSALKGRITYKTEGGNSRPDRGARVIVFPQKRVGEAKLSVTGFRAADSITDFQVAAAGLRALGGDVAVVDDDGNFAISLSSAGSYRILVLSHYQPRDESATIEAPLRTLLEAYFDRPETLLGRVRYYFGQVRYKGEGTEPWDYSFER